MLNHRSVYYSDVGLFLLLSIPVLNQYLVELLLSFGEVGASLFQTDAQWSFVAAFTGLLGILGLGLSLLRLSLPETRDTVLISFIVKFIAAAWLASLYFFGLSPAFGVLAVADGLSGVLLALAYFKHQ